MNNLVKYSDFLAKVQKEEQEQQYYSISGVIRSDEIGKIFLEQFVAGCPECSAKMFFEADSWDRQTVNIDMKCSGCNRKARAAIIKEEVYQKGKETGKKNIKAFAKFIFDNFQDLTNELEGGAKGELE